MLPQTLEHHPTLSPSSFPMLAKCPCYQSGEPGAAAESGTRQHELLAAMLNDLEVIPEDNFGCDAKECEQVAWATDYVRVRTSDNRRIEERLSLIGDDFEEITFGTMDIVAMVNQATGDTLKIMDYKSGGDHGYLPQMAVYARMAMIAYGCRKCEVHELYGRRHFANVYTLNFSETDFVLGIIARVQDPEKQPALCEFCHWCKHQGTCTPATSAIIQVATEYEPEHPVAKTQFSKLSTLHASQITDPKEMSIVLQMAEYVGKWAEAVKAHARDAALKGMVIPGYALEEGQRKRVFTDLAVAFEASGLSLSEFLSCCTGSVADVAKALAAKAGLKSATGKAAKEELNRVLGNFIVYKENAPSLAREA